MSANWILAVDDDPDFREILEILLGGEGYEVVGAADGLEALAQIAARGAPALILLDVRMPRMTGPEFLRVLERSGVDSPVVVLSGDADAGREVEAPAVKRFLPKPTDLGTLLSTVERYAHDA